MKRLVGFVLLLISSHSTIWAEWALIPLEELVADSDLIVVGVLHSAVENNEGTGQGYIRVDQIISGKAITFENRPLLVGDYLKIKWADNWACAEGMHMGREGQNGLWLLEVENDGTVSAGYPGRFISEIDQLTKVGGLGKEKKSKGVVSVDTLAKPSSVLQPTTETDLPKLVVDVSTVPDYSLARAGLTLILAAGLYLLLYKLRFRIR